jgi:hypothetical protein
MRGMVLIESGASWGGMAGGGMVWYLSRCPKGFFLFGQVCGVV